MAQCRHPARYRTARRIIPGTPLVTVCRLCGLHRGLYERSWGAPADVRLTVGERHFSSLQLARRVASRAGLPILDALGCVLG